MWRKRLRYIGNLANAGNAGHSGLDEFLIAETFSDDFFIIFGEWCKGYFRSFTDNLNNFKKTFQTFIVYNFMNWTLTLHQNHK